MKHLHDDIDRYFEAQLTQQEETYLLKTLLKMEERDPIADEALAVMLASRMPPKANKTRRRPIIKHMVGIAASIAVILGFGVFFFQQSLQNNTFAYVDGKKTYDTDMIENIMSTQLKDIEESSDFFAQTLTGDLDDIRDALISDDL